MRRENAFYALAETDLSNGERLADAAVVASDDGSLKGLQAFLLAFFNLYMHAHGIARTECSDFLARLNFDELGNLIHDFSSFLNSSSHRISRSPRVAPANRSGRLRQVFCSAFFCLHSATLR